MGRFTRLFTDRRDLWAWYPAMLAQPCPNRSRYRSAEALKLQNCPTAYGTAGHSIIHGSSGPVREDWFIKRLRPKSGDRITHNQLLVRAFIGVGLVSSGAWVLGYLLVVGLVIGWTFGAWLPTTLGGGLVVGTGAYVYFRFRRYRKQAPDERESTVDGAASVFVRRID